MIRPDPKSVYAVMARMPRAQEPFPQFNRLAAVEGGTLMSAVTQETLQDRLPRPLAFVFSGGVAHGAIQVGMLQAARAREAFLCRSNRAGPGSTS